MAGQGGLIAGVCSQSEGKPSAGQRHGLIYYTSRSGCCMEKGCEKTQGRQTLSTPKVLAAQEQLPLGRRSMWGVWRRLTGDNPSG